MMQYRNWIIGLVAAFQACGMPSEEETLTTEAFELRVPRVRWGPCQPAAEGVECAVVKVPLDYDQPRGAQIDIALSRFPAADQRRKKGSVFVNPGGPGGSGESLVRGGFGASLGEALNREFDIVGFDPRGVGRSIPVTCFDSNNEFETFFEGSFLFPYLKEQRADYYNLLNSLTSKCVSRRQPLLSRMNTANVARDLDLLRAAVGDSKLTYLGSRMEVRLASTMPTCFLSAFAPS